MYNTLTVLYHYTCNTIVKYGLLSRNEWPQSITYDFPPPYLDTETVNIGIVGHVEASTEEVSTVTVLPPLERFGPQTLKLPSF